jgi:UDP-N-acetylmuramyl pentapeptide phosphotransferase/UDP-N-acetylglucosamine-1-phosphate transferase
MDGLAGFQTVSAALAYAVLWGDDVVFFVCALAAAAAGFLAHNFPPARIFMGDAGSTFVGASFACLAVAGIHRGIPLAQSALPLTPFLLDGTFTILRRLSKREPIWKPHRTHLYQRAVQTGLGHREVLLVYLAWMALALAATLAGSRGDVALGLGWASAMGCLFAVWRWVALRESQKLALS